MGRAWTAIADAITKRPGIVLAIAILISVVLAAGTTKLDFATGQDSYLNSDSQIAIDNTQYQELFGGQAIVVVLTAPEGQKAADIINADNRVWLDEMTKRIEAVPGVMTASTPLTTMQWNQNLVMPAEGSNDNAATSVAAGILLATTERETDPEAKDARNADNIKTLDRFNQAAAEPGGMTFDNPAWVSFLLTDNQDEIRKPLRAFYPTPSGIAPIQENAVAGQLIIRLDGNQSIEEESAASEQVLDIVNGTDTLGWTPLVTGASFLLKDINDYLQKGMLTLGAIAVVVMILALALAFRVRWRLVPLLVMVLGVVWTFGLLGFAGFKLSLVTIAGLPILIGLGVEFAIQVHNRIEEEIGANHDPKPFATTVRNIGPALLVATVAAALACLALQVSKVPMIRDFGVLLALGIVLLFVSAIVVPVAVLSLREKRNPTTTYRHQPVVEGAMTKLGHLPRWTAIPLVIVAIGLFAGGLIAEEKTPIQTDPEKWVNQNSEVIHNLDRLREETGSSSELGVFAQVEEGTVFTEPLGDDISAFLTETSVRELATFPDTLQSATSLPMVIFALTEVPGASPLPATAEGMKAAYDVAPDDIKVSLVGDDARALNTVFRTGPSSLEARKEIVDDIDANVTPPPGITAVPSGLAVVGVGLLESLTANRLALTYLAVGAVALWLLIRFLSLVKALITLVPVLLATGLAAVVVKVTGITVSPLTTVSGPLVIAICTEFCALILFRHLEERRAGHPPEEAIDLAAARTGRAFFASSLTTVGGFLVLVFAELPLLKDFGAIVAITVAIALLSAVIVLPPVLVFADNQGWLKVGMRPDDTEADAKAAPSPA